MISTLSTAAYSFVLFALVLNLTLNAGFSPAAAPRATSRCAQSVSVVDSITLFQVVPSADHSTVRDSPESSPFVILAYLTWISEKPTVLTDFVMEAVPPICTPYSPS